MVLGGYTSIMLVAVVSGDGVIGAAGDNQVLTGILQTLLGINDSLGFTHIQGVGVGGGILFPGVAHIHNFFSVLNVIDHPAKSVGLGVVSVEVGVVVVHVSNIMGLSLTHIAKLVINS